MGDLRITYRSLPLGAVVEFEWAVAVKRKNMRWGMLGSHDENRYFGLEPDHIMSRNCVGTAT